MSRYHWYFIGVILLAIVSAVIYVKLPFVFGLDIDGGMRVVLEADKSKITDWPVVSADQKEKMESVRKTIHERVKGIGGVTEPVVVVQGTDRIVVEIPGEIDADAALNRIKSTASLEYYYLKDVQNANNPMAKWKMSSPVGSEQKSYLFTGPGGVTIDSLKQPEEVLKQVVNYEVNKPILTGKDMLPNAKANISGSKTVINIEFNNEGTKVFREFTRAHVGDYLAAFYDGKLLTAPVINEPIPDGRAEVSGFETLKQARETAEQLKSGSLPVPLKVIAKDTVEPTLGRETFEKVKFAGIIGLAIVVLFMLVFYRLPGLIADIALCLYTAFVIAIFKLLGVTLSLGGVAALIISIGMAVDANILIFERLKEELKSGKTLRAAIDAGFSKAFTAIFDSNVCTAITCAILMWKGSPSVQSFALTLLVGVAVSMFTAITVTRVFLHLLVGAEWAQKPSLFGLSTTWTNKEGLKWDIVGKRNYFFILSGILIIPGLYFLITAGLKPGIEFKPGSQYQVTFSKNVTVSEIRNAISQDFAENEIQLANKDGQNKVAYIKIPRSESTKNVEIEQEKNKLIEVLDKNIGIATRDTTGKPVPDYSSTVEPTISKELTTNAFWSVVYASLAIVLFLASRFAIGGFIQGLKFGVCAVIALIHDTAFILGLFAILGKFAGWEVDSLFVTAVLTVIGFSVHDTIVVFDRIRENLKHRLRGETFEQLCNKSILQTLTRSINTSLTVVFTLSMLIAFGGPMLRHFYVALLVGIIIGTYSSIFNATPLIIVWEKIVSGSGGTAPKKAINEKPMVAQSELGIPASDQGSIEGELLADKLDQQYENEEVSKTARAKRKTTKKKRF